MVKTGDIAYIKLTGEPVFILRIEEPSDPALGSVVFVRSVGMTPKSGALYTIRQFYTNELETFAEKAARDWREMSDLRSFVSNVQKPEVPNLTVSNIEKKIIN